MYTTFLLFFFEIFKVYSRQVSSSSVAGLCLFAKGEVKNLSKVELLYWNGPTVHVWCFMLAHASTKTFVSRIHIRQPSPKKQRKKSWLAEKFVSRVTRQPRYHCTCLMMHISCFNIIQSLIRNVFGLLLLLALWVSQWSLNPAKDTLVSLGLRRTQNQCESCDEQKNPGREPNPGCLLHNHSLTELFWKGLRWKTCYSICISVLWFTI